MPVVDKEIKWPKRYKDPAFIGMTKEAIKQASHSKKRLKRKKLDEDEEPVLSKNGKPVLVDFYSPVKPIS